MPEIFLQLDGRQQGPFSAEQVRAMLAEGKVTPATPAWHQGRADWTTVGAVLGTPPVPGGMPPVPPPPPPVAKQGLSGCALAAIIVAVVLAVSLPFIACLAGVALGPITAGIKKAKENAAMQQARAIDMSMFSYATDHNGKYPDGTTSTEVFQKLLDEKYVSDPGIFYISGAPGKTRPTGSRLSSENVCFDVTTGVTDKSPDEVPLVFSTGYTMSYDNGARATPNGPTAFPGMAVVYKSNRAQFIKAGADGSIVVSGSFDAQGEEYRQLKP